MSGVEDLISQFLGVSTISRSNTTSEFNLESNSLHFSVLIFSKQRPFQLKQLLSSLTSNLILNDEECKKCIVLYTANDNYTKSLYNNVLNTYNQDNEKICGVYQEQEINDNHTQNNNNNNNNNHKQ